MRIAVVFELTEFLDAVGFHVHSLLICLGPLTVHDVDWSLVRNEHILDPSLGAKLNLNEAAISPDSLDR